MAEPRVVPAVSLSTLIPGPEVEEALCLIDAATKGWFGRTEAASVGDFCRRAVECLRNFVKNVGSIQDFKVFRADGKDQLVRALRKAVQYVEQKCSISGFAKLAAIEALGGQSLASTEMDVRNDVTKAVRLHVEVVVEAAKRNVKDAYHQGRPIQMALQRVAAVQVWREIRVLCNRTEFGNTFMEGCREDLADESSTLNGMWRLLQENMNVQSCIVRKLDYIQKEVDAGRQFHERDCCPEIFFVVPDTSGWSRLDRVDRWQIFTKNMHLVFMCTTFFEEIQATSVHPAGPPKQFRGECSDLIDIRQPSDFFLKYSQAIKLSIRVIQTIGIAAAFFGVSVEDVLPSNINSICALDNLSEIMGKGLGAAEAAFSAAEDVSSAAEESSLDPERGQLSSRPGKLHRLKRRILRWKESGSSAQPPAPAGAGSRARDDPAHLVMQHYLASNSVDWKTSVHDKLTLAHNDHHGYTYVCQSDPHHKAKWEQRQVEEAPMR